MRDPHEVLGLRPGATIDEIRTAYRQLARQFHPDRFVDASPLDQREAHARMQAINHAFDVLMDPAERERFERHRRLREKRAAADASQPAPAGEGSSRPSSDGVRFTAGQSRSDSSSDGQQEPSATSRAWRAEPQPDGLYIREYSGWGDAHWVFVHAPGGRAGKMNVTTGEVTIEREELREEVLRVLQHFALDSWS